MKFEKLFDKVKNQFKNTDTSTFTDFLAIQINITGPAEESGTFYIEVKDSVLSIEPYEYIDRSVLITISSMNFLKILNRKLDPIVAFTTGKLKVDGDMGKALELKKFI